MSVAAARPSAANPDVSDLLTRARAIGELAREHAQQTESDRRVGDDMIERMRQAELFRVMQPRSYGGLEHGFDVFAPIVASSPMALRVPPPVALAVRSIDAASRQ